MVTAMSFEEAWSYADKIEGWFAECEARQIWNLASACVREQGILEVGCYKGRSTAMLAQFLKGTGLHLFIIDPLIPREGQSQEAIHTALKSVLEVIGTPYTLFLCKTSELENSPSASFPPSIDLLHVDGQHDAEGIETDCKTLLPLVRRGGWACFHDYGNPAYRAIQATVDDFLKGWEAHGTTGLLRYARKP